MHVNHWQGSERSRFTFSFPKGLVRRVLRCRKLKVVACGCVYTEKFPCAGLFSVRSVDLEATTGSAQGSLLYSEITLGDAWGTILGTGDKTGPAACKANPYPQSYHSGPGWPLFIGVFLKFPFIKVYSMLPSPASGSVLEGRPSRISSLFGFLPTITQAPQRWWGPGSRISRGRLPRSAASPSLHWRACA